MSTASGNSGSFSNIGKAIVQLNKPTLFQLFDLHRQARGERVEKAEEADFQFGLHQGDVSAFDTNTILSDFLSG